MMSSKGMMAFFFISILLASSSLLAKVAEAKVIGYPPIEGGDKPAKCDPKKPNSCKPPPSNRYERGCSQVNQCRGPPHAATLGVGRKLKE